MFKDRKEKMKKIKVKFLDFIISRRIEDDWYYRTLSKFYNMELSDNPDYIIDGGLGHEHLDPKYDHCVKIVTIGENYAPDFNLFDYAIAFDHIAFGDRYLRKPLYAFYPEFDRLRVREIPNEDYLLNRGFCSFVVSDAGADPLRIAFYHELSKYKSIASGGGVLNNVGGRVADKNVFCSGYKFNIAIENSSCPGYVTEKVMQALAVNTVPIYFGDPTVSTDINPESIVWIRDRNDVKRAIEEVVFLDTHDEAYLAKCHANPLVKSVEEHEAETIAFFKHIFDQPLERAKRLTVFGNQRKYRSRQYRLYRLDDLWRKPALAIYNLRRKFDRFK